MLVYWLNGFRCSSELTSVKMERFRRLALEAHRARHLGMHAMDELCGADVIAFFMGAHSKNTWCAGCSCVSAGDDRCCFAVLIAEDLLPTLGMENFPINQIQSSLPCFFVLLCEFF